MMILVVTFVLYFIIIGNVEAGRLRNLNNGMPSVMSVERERERVANRVIMPIPPVAIQSYESLRAKVAESLGVNTNVLNFKEANELLAGIASNGPIDKIWQDSQKRTSITEALADMLCARCRQLGDMDCIRRYCQTTG